LRLSCRSSLSPLSFPPPLRRDRIGRVTKDNVPSRPAPLISSTAYWFRSSSPPPLSSRNRRPAGRLSTSRFSPFPLGVKRVSRTEYYLRLSRVLRRLSSLCFLSSFPFPLSRRKRVPWNDRSAPRDPRPRAPLPFFFFFPLFFRLGGLTRRNRGPRPRRLLSPFSSPFSPREQQPRPAWQPAVNGGTRRASSVFLLFLSLPLFLYIKGLRLMGHIG